MRPAWLWDRKTTDEEARKILKDFSDKRAILLAAVLLARKNEPKEVFKEYLDRLAFCQYWPAIKRQMRKDRWNEPRIIFWQAIYENLRERYQKEGIFFRKEIKKPKDAFLTEIGKEISVLRKEKGFSQEKLAKQLNVSQQMISRIESGNENISLGTLKNVLSAMNKKIKIEFT